MSRLRYVEQELAKKRGKTIDDADQVENEIKHAEDELYKIPEHLRVRETAFLCSRIFSFYSVGTVCFSVIIT